MSKYYSSSIAFGANQTKTEQVVVSQTKIGNVTTDAVSGALTVDEVPTLDSLNPVSSDGVARAVIQAGAELPTRSSEDTGRVLTVKNSDGDLDWEAPPTGIPDMAGKDGKILGAVDDNGTMKAQWINPPEELPGLTDNAGKVLKVNADATGVEWANESTVTVDQTYNASSTNAQSGTAVAQAISAIPSASYTAGTGIDITSNVVSADIDNSTIKTVVAPSTLQTVDHLDVEVSAVYAAFALNSDVKSKLTTDSSAKDQTIKIHIPGNTFMRQGQIGSGYFANVELCSDQWFNPGSTAIYIHTPLTTTYNSSTGYTFIDEQDIEIPCYMPYWTWDGAPLNPSGSSGNFFIGFFRCNGHGTSNDAFGKNGTSLSGNPVIISEDVASNTLCVANPIPAFSSDEDGMVLGVVNGALAWVSLT